MFFGFGTLGFRGFWVWGLEGSGNPMFFGIVRGFGSHLDGPFLGGGRKQDSLICAHWMQPPSVILGLRETALPPFRYHTPTQAFGHIHLILY